MIKKFVFNASTNVIGGGVQNSANFISYALNDNSVDWFFIVSKEVAENLKSLEINTSDESKFYICEFSPARNFKIGRKIKKICNILSPKLVYTMAGPSYVKFNQLHVCGLSNPYLLNFDYSKFFLNRNIIDSFKLLFGAFVQFFYTFNIDTFIFQTESSSKFFLKYHPRCTKKNSSVIGNALPDRLLDSSSVLSDIVNVDTKKNINLKSIIVPSAYYPHKNIEIIFEYINSDFFNGDCEFYLTISDSAYSKLITKFGDSSYIKNIGPFAVSDAKSIYKNYDFVLLPSCLEVFSTTYLEALYFNKPLLVADFPFSREICSEFASYYHFNSLLDFDKKLRSLSHKINSRRYVLETYGTYSDRYKGIMSVLQNL